MSAALREVPTSVDYKLLCVWVKTASFISLEQAHAEEQWSLQKGVWGEST